MVDDFAFHRAKVPLTVWFVENGVGCFFHSHTAKQILAVVDAPPTIGEVASRPTIVTEKHSNRRIANRNTVIALSNTHTEVGHVVVPIAHVVTLLQIRAVVRVLEHLRVVALDTVLTVNQIVAGTVLCISLLHPLHKVFRPKSTKLRRKFLGVKFSAKLAHLHLICLFAEGFVKKAVALIT